MASIKLKHASGNSTILNSPAANPTNDVTLKLPSTSGTAGQVLKVASANHSATNAELEFAADAGGKILQVVGQNLTTQMTSTSTSYVDTGLTASITPSATSSKILILLNISFHISGDSNGYLGLFRDSTEINSGAGGTYNAMVVLNGNSTAFRYSGAQQACNFLDSPSTTSAITYKVKTKAINPYTVGINRRLIDTNHGTSSNITLMEVAA